jgi:hypothetical protein
MSASVRIKRLHPGDDLDAYCGRCKAERAHQVVALNADGTPASVVCRTCGNRHRFRQKRESASPAATRVSKGGDSWLAGPEPGAAARPARPYSPKEVYAAGEWVEHPKFGRGQVTQTRGGKVEVRFESGTRLLVQAG